MSNNDSVKHSLMTSSQEFLNETNDTSRISSLEVDNNSKFKNKKRSKTLLDPTCPTSNTQKTGTIIVHPSYSHPSSTAFHYQAPLSHTSGFMSKYLPQSDTESGRVQYLPPQQYGGLLEELASRDKSFKIKMTEDELNRNQFECYRCWLLIIILASLGTLGGSIWLLCNPIEQIQTWVVGLVVFLVAWNLIQCALEYLAIITRSFAQADAVMKSFCLFLLFGFASGVAVNIGLEMSYMEGKSSILKILIAVGVSLGMIVLFYLTILAGAIKVYVVLKKKQSLQTSLKEDIILPSQLHII